VQSSLISLLSAAKKTASGEVFATEIPAASVVAAMNNSKNVR
jgi:hypothetical protein